MVLSIFVEKTTPSRVFRLARTAASSFVSAIGCLLLVQLDLALAQDRVEPGDVLADLPDAGVAVELPRDVLEAEVEELLLGLRQARHQVGVAQVAKLRRAGHHTAS